MGNITAHHTESYHCYKAGEWELYIFFAHRGTRSEGAFGVLLENKSMVPPASSENEVVETPLGKMKYYRPDSQIPWAPRGWLFANVSEIPRSSSDH